MKVGLINIEPKIFNTVYMQITHHHREKGDTVRLVGLDRDLDQYGKLYCSSLFDFTDKTQVPNKALCGGTGFDLATKLPFDCELDYSLYPACECSYIWFSRGCIRNCKFCVVRDKEGYLSPVEPKNLNPAGKYVQVQDNNFFANPDWKKAIWKLWSYNQPVDFQGVDVRLLTADMIDCLRLTKHHKQLKIAWDNPKQNLTENIKALTSQIAPSNVMCYVLIGYGSTTEQDLMRIQVLRQLKVSPYVMCIDHQDRHQKKFQKWVNGHAYWNVKWEDFQG